MKLPSLALCATVAVAISQEPLNISGIYPHLAAFNPHGECGIGAVVPWAGKLWWITYPPHMPTGSEDKLYSVKPDMKELEISPESVGGTHACRMIHKESNQLIIGPYFISADGKVRVADIKTKLIGRMTAIARHLTDPANLVYFVDMEGAIFEVNVHTLDVKKLFTKPVPGWHGKGGYTAQGRLVVSNNGEAHVGGVKSEYLATLPPKSDEDAGVLAEWDGKEWRILERKQFLDVTGPGGINGAPNDKAPLWAFGWDKRSVILKLLDGGEWSTFRLPKGSYAFDPKHGWYTEWPRIRDLADGKFLMVAHGQMFDFPGTFSKTNTAGIRPVCTHLRYVPDLTSWGNKLVIAADDTSIIENPLAGQSQSNLWFGTREALKSWGPTAGWGGVWIGDRVKEGQTSDPFLFAGYQNRTLHISHQESSPVTFSIESDAKGDGKWEEIGTIQVPPKGYRAHAFSASAAGEWVRLKAGRECFVSAYFHLSNPNPHAVATGFPKIDPAKSALVRPAKTNRNLQVRTKDGYYEVDEKLNFAAATPNEEASAIQSQLEIKQDYSVDAASVIITDSKKRRWRLPKTDAAYDAPTTPLRGIREIQSERFAANIHGIFYEIPRAADDKNGVDFLKLRPVSTHRSAITDFCTWRGLLVLAGGAEVPGAGKVVKSADGKVSLWFGAVDDLWRFGKPTGVGGPWKDSDIKANDPSDPYLMTNFDRKSLTVTHNAIGPVDFKIEIDVFANGFFREYTKFTVRPGEKGLYEFPEGFGAHWVRLTPSASCKATAEFRYE